jgi:hypothetical protein
MNIEDYGLVPHECKTVKPGDRFGRIVILAIGKPKDSYAYKALYRCDCGAEVVSALNSVQSGTTTSCGCKNRESLTKHGLWNSPLYRVWRHMMLRCHTPEHPKFKHYGARGITVCERWHDVSAFAADMGPTYASGLKIERKDNNAGYSPENCRWATNSEQQRNKRNNIVITMNGKTQVLQDWCNELGVHYGLAWERIKVRGWEPVKALTTPARKWRDKPRASTV